MGILTARDVLRAVAGDVDPSDAPVGQVDDREPISVAAATTLEAAEA